MWHVTTKFDPRAAVLADRHYSRETPGSPQFLPPGRTLVLLHESELALWGVVHNVFRGVWRWRVSIFRNESPLLLSSYLVETATDLTRQLWQRRYGGLPAVTLTTEVDPTAVRRKRDPGRCFRKAGWHHVRTQPAGHGRTEKLVFEAPPP